MRRPMSTAKTTMHPAASPRRNYMLDAPAAIRQPHQFKPPQPEQPKSDPLEQIVKLEREMSQVQEKYKHAEENYGSELLNLVVAKG